MSDKSNVMMNSTQDRDDRRFEYPRGLLPGRLCRAAFKFAGPSNLW